VGRADAPVVWTVGTSEEVGMVWRDASMVGREEEATGTQCWRQHDDLHCHLGEKIY